MTPKYIAYLNYQKEYRERMKEERDRVEMFGKSKPKNEKIIFLKKWAEREGFITTWRLNEKFFEWHQKFYKSSPYGYKSNRALTYYANKLVKSGYLNESKRIGVSDGLRLYGVNYKTIWEII